MAANVALSPGETLRKEHLRSAQVLQPLTASLLSPWTSQGIFKFSSKVTPLVPALRTVRTVRTGSTGRAHVGYISGRLQGLQQALVLTRHSMENNQMQASGGAAFDPRTLEAEAGGSL